MNYISSHEASWIFEVLHQKDQVLLNSQCPNVQIKLRNITNNGTHGGPLFHLHPISISVPHHLSKGNSVITHPLKSTV